MTNKPLVLEVLEPRMAHKFPVAHHQPHPVGAQHPKAKIQQRGAVARVRIAAAVVEQHVYLALAEVPLRAVQAQAQLARARQQAHQPHG